MDIITVRCRACTALNEIYVEDQSAVMLIHENATTYYALQVGERFSCCECGRIHSDGAEVALVMEARQ